MALKGGVIELSIPSLPALRTDLRAFASRNRLDLTALFLLTVLAAVPRLVLITSIPHGLHGDEAWTGLDAQRVLNEGWIGPYVSSALGQPSGPLYFAAPFVGIFGHTMFAVRFAMAVLGIATVPMLYLAARLMFNRTLAVFAAVILSASVWHLHFSRIGFMVIAWPLMEAITLFFLFLGLRTGKRRWYALAGASLGLGVYTYNAYPIFLLPIGLFLLWLIVRRSAAERLQLAGRLVLLSVVAFIFAAPLIGYAVDSSNDYFAHHKLISVFKTPDWQEGSLGDRVDIMYKNTRHYVDAAFWSGKADFADGAGTQPMVDRLSLALIILGFVISVWRWRDPASLLPVLAVLLIPFGAIVNVTGGRYRQSFGMVPFLAILIATPLALWWQLASELGRKLRTVSYVAIALVVALIAYYNFNYYFIEFPDTGAARYTFAFEITDASQFIHDLPGNPYVYFYSGRWGYNYETRRFLAADRKGEDRSVEFTDTHTFSLVPNHKGPLVYVFLDQYMGRADEVASQYPGGQMFSKAGPKPEIEFRAYYLPNGASGPGAPGTTQPTPGATGQPSPGATGQPTPAQTATAGGDVRDARRVSDLAALKGALEQYRQKHGGYPNNQGGIQTLCIYPNDAGCALREVIDPIPKDPFGDQGINGYFYVSDGRTYTVFAIRETTLFPACPQHPAHLARFASVLCVSGP